MAWFKRDKKSIDQNDARRKSAACARKDCGSSANLRNDRVSQGFGSEPLRVSQVPVPFQNEFETAPGIAARRFAGPRHDAGMTSTDPLKFVDTKPYASR